MDHLQSQKDDFAGCKNFPWNKEQRSPSRWSIYKIRKKIWNGTAVLAHCHTNKNRNKRTDKINKENNDNNTTNNANDETNDNTDADEKC